MEGKRSVISISIFLIENALGALLRYPNFDR